MKRVLYILALALLAVSCDKREDGSIESDMRRKAGEHGISQALRN